MNGIMPGVLNFGCPLGYIGPGGGVAISVSLVTAVVIALSVIFGPVFYPVLMLWHVVRKRRVRFRRGYRKVVVLGLDGMDPKVASEMMSRGELPNLAGLAKEGTFSEL